MGLFFIPSSLSLNKDQNVHLILLTSCIQDRARNLQAKTTAWRRDGRGHSKVCSGPNSISNSQRYGCCGSGNTNVELYDTIRSQAIYRYFDKNVEYFAIVH